MIIFLKVPSESLGQGTTFFLFTAIVQNISKKSISKKLNKLSQIFSGGPPNITLVNPTKTA